VRDELVVRENLVACETTRSQLCTDGRLRKLPSGGNRIRIGYKGYCYRRDYIAMEISLKDKISLKIGIFSRHLVE
jgi:hypothetical protein